MPPTRTRKRKSQDTIALTNAQAATQTIPLKTGQATSSTISAPARHTGTMSITLAQKQALIDNLQLEITERARKLRAQYNLQAQGLRTRVEIRINRVPAALRCANMDELFAKHGTMKTTSRALPALPPSPVKAQAPVQAMSPQRGIKRPSDSFTADKENEHQLHFSAKRQKPLTSAPISKLSEAQVLSPRSPNSRTLPRSPIHQSPYRPLLSRPLSPLKPTAPALTGGAAGMLTNMVEKAKSRGGITRKATGAGVGRGKKAIAPPQVGPRTGRGRATSTSGSSDISTGTTIVRKPVPVSVPAPKVAVKKSVMGTIKAMGGQKKATVASADVPVASGRQLRKRG